MLERHRLVDTSAGSGDLRIQSEGSHPGTPDASHELTDARARPLLLFALASSLGVAVLALLTAALLFWLKQREERAEPPAHPLAAARDLPPLPRLQTLRALDAAYDVDDPSDPFSQRGWLEHEIESRITLSTYGWIDEQAGVVRIPIERAMELVLAEGFPRPAAQEERR